MGVVIACLCTVLNAQNLIGEWSGQLNVSPQMSLKLVFRISVDSTITMDSPDQGAYGIPTETVYLSNDSISVRVSKLMMSYTGHLTDNTIYGTFKQGAVELPLTLTLGEEKARRPQTPVAPFPYTTEEVKIAHDDVTLAGTLTIPENASTQTPIVVMVTGSGQQNRDEEMFEHKPFAVIADFLARNGVASLRYDDRGVGESIGSLANATTADFAVDAESVVSYIRATNRFGRVGLLGHSEGGLIGYMLAAKPGVLDFLVSIAGPAVRGDSILISQNRNALAKSGITGSQADDFIDALTRAFQLKINGYNQPLTDEHLSQLYPTWSASPLSMQLAQSLRGLFKPGGSSAWTDYFIAYSPADDMRRINIPTLIVYGGKDTQVPAAINAETAHRNAPMAQVVVFPYANHLMQHAVTGQVEEYKTITETISPEVLSEILHFIQ